MGKVGHCSAGRPQLPGNPAGEEICWRDERSSLELHGKPVAKLVLLSEKARRIFGCLEGTVTRYGDLVSPIDERWTADE